MKNLNSETTKVLPLEIDLLLQAIKQRYGYDFSNYQTNVLQRRFQALCQRLGKSHISECISLVVHDDILHEIIASLSIPVTEMFRQPALFQYFRESIVPWLAGFPNIRIWCAGCASGEEAYSLAIILHEAGLLSRTTIFATDISEALISKAQQGIIATKDLALYIKNYHQSGGRENFSDYYTAKTKWAIIAHDIRRAISFNTHNLVCDSSFTEAHIIFCCNVLIYFNASLKARVMDLFNKSLMPYGILCFGDKESLPACPMVKHYQPQTLAYTYRKIP